MTKATKIALISFLILIGAAAAIFNMYDKETANPAESLQHEEDNQEISPVSAPVDTASSSDTVTISEPDYMNQQELESMNLAADQKIQVLQRDDSGKAIVYKVINSDADIVADYAPVKDWQASSAEVQAQ